jgi:cellulose synthase/poly-beta-1,6-N-acetylglucosamine synthase-like glycosyltransferase
MERGRFAPVGPREGSAWRRDTDQPAFRPAPGRIPLDPARIRSRLALCPEIECIRPRISPGMLAAAQLRAAEIGVGADRVLVAAGEIGEEPYAQALAQYLGVGFETLARIGRADCPLGDERLIEAVAGGMLPLHLDGELVFVAALPGMTARNLASSIPWRPDLAARLRLTTQDRLHQFVMRHCEGEIEYRAAQALRAEQPEFSAGIRPAVSRYLFACFFAGLVGFCFWLNAKLTLTAIDLALALIFLGWIGLRLLGVLTPGFFWRRRPAIPDDRLPAYSVIVALYREAAALPALIEALLALDYPREKLDIKLVVEPDDTQTRFALAGLKLDPCIEIVVAPAIGPRTKPKALNAALPFARGVFVAVYDAEDRPEPDQLRRAVEAFVAANARLACVQARLTIDNSADSWLTRMFTAEYSGLFDVFLPGISAWRLPLPLGGSSNHFRAAALRAVGAWDPFNVTEDADLGMRLARLGYRTDMISSSTYEEAPAGFATWIRQRTRWFKGWMQTWLVHMRQPLRLMREMGLAGFVVFQLVVGGTVLAALVHLLFAAALVWDLGVHAAEWKNKATADLVLAGLHGTTLVTGYVISAALGLIGLARRRVTGCAWALALMPVYWLLLSIAAWRALLHLIVKPYRWEKTEHGLARTSRLGRRLRTRAPLRDISSNRRPPPQAYVSD